MLQPSTVKKLVILNKNQTKNVSVMFPAHRENLTSYLSPILGQYGIKNSDFIATFVPNFHNVTNNSFLLDSNTENIEAEGLINYYDLFVPCRLIILKGGQFLIEPQFPHVGSVVRVSYKKRRYKRRKLKLLRNWKKLMQLTLFSKQQKNLEMAYNFNSNLTKNLQNNKEIYLKIRNSLFRKR